MKNLLLSTLNQIAFATLLLSANILSLNALEFPSTMATSGCFRTYAPLKEFYENGLTPQLASQKMCADKAFRKKVQRKYARILMQSLDEIIADKSRIECEGYSDKGREFANYNANKFFPKEVVLLDEYMKDWGYFDNARVSAVIYPNLTIAEAYHKLRKKHLDKASFPNALGEFVPFVPLDFANKIFPLTMPTSDYSAFIDYDKGAKITIKLSKNELEKLKNDDSSLDISNIALSNTLELEMGESEIFWWDFGVITWADSSRMLFEFDECVTFYFKQVGNDVWLIGLFYQCV